MDEWQFVLILPVPAPASRDAIDWAALFPPSDVTCWIIFDEACRYLEMEPGVAVPDRM